MERRADGRRSGGTVNVNNTNTTNNNVFFDAGIAGTGALTLNTTGGGNNGIVFRTGAGSYSGALQANSGNVFVNAGGPGVPKQRCDAGFCCNAAPGRKLVRVGGQCQRQVPVRRW